jgi:cystathionine beta-lyase/cystathionine gamma-synthase
MFQLAIRMDVFLRACKMASIVGIVLAIINRGDHILFGIMTFNSWIKILKTFFVPFCVSGISSVFAIRREINFSD